MKLSVPFVFVLSFFCGAATAQTIERDSFDVGVEAFNAGNCDEALRIMKKYEKTQPAAAYVVRVCSLMQKKEGKKSVPYNAFLNNLYKGDLSQLDKFGLIDRFNEEISGFSGAMYVHSLHGEAERGSATAAFRLGLLHQEGRGTDLNFNSAAHYFQKAADKGSPDAMNSIGVYYRFGIGVKKDEKKAEEILKNAVLKKNVNAAYNLGQLYADREDFLQAWLLADLSLQKTDPKTEKKKYARIKNLLTESEKQLSPLQKAYLEKFRPFWLKPVLSARETARFDIPRELPLPPKQMIEETSFMKFIKKDAFDNRYKTFFPLMPAWVDVAAPGEKNPDLEGKNPPAPAPEEQQTISALYFRPSDPRFVHLTLTRENSAVPVMVGDILTLTVYTPLYENDATRKGGHMYIKNTGYRINVRDPAGILAANGSFVLTPLSAQTARQESWLSRRFVIRKEGTAIIQFVPQTAPDGRKIFPHTLKITATKGLPPK